MSDSTRRFNKRTQATRIATAALTLITTAMAPAAWADPDQLLAAQPTAWSPDDAADKDRFGASVAIQEGRLAVGATAVDEPSDGAGAVYLFQQEEAGWRETAVLHLEGVGADARFGSAVALADDELAAGGSGVYAGQGAIYLFTLDNDEWRQQHRFLLPESQDFTFFGSTLAMADGLLLAGAPGFDAGAPDSGIVMTYTRGDDGSWTESGRLQPDTPLEGERFGTAIALKGNRALVGAAASQGGGAAYVFEYLDGEWSQVTRLSEAVGDRGAFGTSVALAGDTALVGAPYAVSDAGDPQGAAFIYAPRNGNWERQATLRSDAPNRRDEFGSAVALQDDMALVSSPRDDAEADDAGAVFVFAREGQSWTQAGRLSRTAPAAYDEFGRSLAVDAASGVTLVGSPNDAASDTANEYPGTVTSYR